MKIKTLFPVITILFLPSFIYCQAIEKVIVDEKDSTSGYYLAIQPQSKNIRGVMVLLTSFLPPEGLLPETKLHNTASVNDILTIVASTKQKFYADSAAITRLTMILKHAASKYSADISKFVLAGYGEAGNIALRYTELSYENPSAYLVQPKAVVGIDTPVDLFGLWHWAERQIKKNYWPGAVGDAKYYLDVMTKENGTIYTNPEAYKKLSPFNRAEQAIGHERYLQQVAIRLYYDTDIEWQLKNRRNSFYDTKMADGSELINRLLLAGNDHAEFIASKQPGLKSDGTRHPNSISIVNEVECIHWIKKNLGIFDAHTWVSPYQLAIPNGWTTERFSLPPGFAPGVIYKGVEDIRFAPGWGDTKSEEHWTYGFLWWLEGSPKLSATGLQASLEAYYGGLVLQNSEAIPPGKLVPVTTNVKKTNTAAGDVETFQATIRMTDYHTGRPMILNCLIHIKECKDQQHTAAWFEVSPQAFGHPVWKQMNAVGADFNCKTE
jgi:hypothetical protein